MRSSPPPALRRGFEIRDRRGDEVRQSVVAMEKLARQSQMRFDESRKNQSYDPESSRATRRRFRPIFIRVSFNARV